MARGTLSPWTGPGFEIWFFVVWLPGKRGALWVRLTRFADSSGAGARVWAVVSDDDAASTTPRDAVVTFGGH